MNMHDALNNKKYPQGLYNEGETWSDNPLITQENSCITVALENGGSECKSRGVSSVPLQLAVQKSGP
jgi:hypothetical protein